MSDPARPLIDCLSTRTTTVASLLRRASMLEDIQRALRQHLEAPWSLAPRVANIRGDTLVLFVETPAAANRLRMLAPEVTAFLNERFGLACQKLETRIVPEIPHASGGV